MPRKMVWVRALVCALFVLSPLLGVADDQAPDGAQNEIALNVFETAYWATNGALPLFIGYQRVFTDHFTLSILPVFGYWGWDPEPYFEFQQWVEVDWHPFNKGLKGFFLGLAIVGVVANILPDGGRGTTYFLGFAPAIGYQVLLPWNLDLDFAVALTLGGRLAGDTSGNTSFGFLSDHRRAEIGLGYRF